MGFQVCMGAMMKCSFGTAPGALIVLPQNKVMSATPVANIMDNKPMTNIPPFGTCNSMTNPQVIAATAAAGGTLTPMNCSPVIPAPWAAGAPTVMVANMPALNNSSKLMCAWGGIIEILNPGQTNIQIP